jgi:pSer/pThr/pTyr-binding forkhead associated (FHA) protein
MKLSLVVINGKPEGKEIPIRLTQFLIGRDADCHLRPASPLISKRHCAILIRNEQAFIRDFGSTNGTILNQVQLQGEAELHDGDTLKIGPLSFQVKLTEVAPAKAPDKDSSKDTVADEAGSTMIGQKVAPADNTQPMPVLKAGEKKGSQDEDLIAEILFDGSVPPGGGSPSDIPMGTTVMAMMGAGGEAPPEEEKKPEPEKARSSKAKIQDNKATSDAAKAILEKYMRRPRG